MTIGFNSSNVTNLGIGAAGNQSSDSKSLIDQIIKKSSDIFYQSYKKQSNLDKDNFKKMLDDFMSLADKDGSKSLSKDELASVNTDKNPVASFLTKDLLANFETYDTNGDGELSFGELKDALLGGKFSKQEAKAMLDANKAKNLQYYMADNQVKSNTSDASIDIAKLIKTSF